MTDPRTINVIVKHSLGKDVALERIKAMKSGDSVKLIDLEMHHDVWKFVAAVYGVSVIGTLEIKDDYVSLETEPLPWWTALFVWRADGLIEEALKEALK